ncbi:MAG: serine/threonine protein kinase [Burkholderiales bacterium]|nr:serine/threonine protein kinase [Burkholderiales bacterium]
MTTAHALTDAKTTHLGRYEVLVRLGEGAMGTVYKAHDPLLDRLVAIKTVNLNLPKEDIAEYEARFYQEAKAAGGLSHPNIVVIYDIGKTDRLAYMAMEYLEGRELRSILSERTCVSLDEAVNIAAQVADGLTYAHGRGVIHRDIKPTNIMLNRDGVAKITDFGIARMRSSELKTMTGMILGSPRYMSPEQVAGKRADQRSDIFSLGVVLYEMLTGQAPFQADTVHGVMYQTMNATAPAPSTIKSGLPKILDYIVAKALAKVPEARYQSAKELADDLRASLLAGNSGDLEKRMLARLRESARQAADTQPVGTRTEDKLAKLTGGSDTTTEEIPLKAVTTTPSFSVSDSFDSSAATLRLAALSGLASEFDAKAKSARLAAAESAPARPRPSTIRPSRSTHVAPWLWAVAALSATVAAYLLLR